MRAKKNVIAKVQIGELVGKTILEISGGGPGDDEIKFVCGNGVYRLFKTGKCFDVKIHCSGSIQNLINSPVTISEFSKRQVECVKISELSKIQSGCEINELTNSWTLCKFSTELGDVEILWFGRSNKYSDPKMEFTST